MRFNKTELTVLADAKRSGGFVGVNHGVQGPSGRKRHFGGRRLNAVVSLRDKGLLVRVSGEDGGSPLYSGNGQGQNGVVYSSTWKLTPAAEGL